MTQFTQPVTAAARPTYLWQSVVVSLTAHTLLVAGYLALSLLWPGTRQDPVVPYPPERDYAAITIPSRNAAASQARENPAPISVVPAPQAATSQEALLEPADTSLQRAEATSGELTAGRPTAEHGSASGDASPATGEVRPRRDETRDHSPPTISSAGALSRANSGVDSLLTPRVLINPAPRYPAEALQQQLQGTVLLRVQVAADGSVVAVRVLRSSGAQSLDAAAVDAVQRWRFLPARDSDAAPREVNVPIEFVIQRR
jgi:periplasmic protein TonB